MGETSMKASRDDQQIITLNYMDQFSCIGAACETHCCQGWQVNIDEKNFKTLQQAMAKNPADREAFRKRVKRTKKNGSQTAAYAQINLNKADQLCPFFTAEGLCEVHCRFGEETLSSTCFSYPRKLNLVHGDYELTGALSCPEIARLCLLQPESTEVKIAERPDLNPQRLALLARCAANDPYQAQVSAIREIALEFLQLRAFPTTARLFFFSYFANRIGGFYYAGCPPFQENQLQAELGQVADEARIQQLAAGYQGLSSPIDLPIQLVNELLAQKSGLKVCRSFFSSIWNQYGEDAGADSWTLDKQKLSANYLARRDQLFALFPEQLDGILERYCRNYLVSNLYSENRNLLEYLQGLLVRLAICTFLTVSHPKLDAVLAGELPPTAAAPLLEEVVIEAFHLSSRAMEHDDQLWVRFSAAAKEHGLTSLAHLIQLLKFIQP